MPHGTALQDENLVFTEQIPVPFSSPCCFASFCGVCCVRVTDMRILWSILIPSPAIFGRLHSTCRPVANSLCQGVGAERARLLQAEHGMAPCHAHAPEDAQELHASRGNSPDPRGQLQQWLCDG